MDLKPILLENMRFERRLTRETIAAMTDGEMQFRPTPEQMCFGGQALHIISCQETLLDAFRGNGWTWDRGVNLERFPTQEAILARFDEMMAAEAAYYEGMNAGEFGRMVPTGWGPPEPLLQLVMSFLTHEAHHRGQMVTYLRLKGMKPPEY